MVNVAVSRAICQFVIVTDHELFNHEGKEINALLKYIKYNTLDSEIVQSKIVSVFDLLYKDYSSKLNSLSRRLLSYSRYKSENIMDTILDGEFQKEEYVDYIYRRQIKLKNMLLDLSFLTEEEKDYVNHGASVDFVVADALNKIPLLFIEVDGFRFHKNNPEQLERDKLKDSIAFKCGIPILRFETDGIRQSEEQIIKRIREQLLSK